CLRLIHARGGNPRPPLHPFLLLQESSHILSTERPLPWQNASIFSTALTAISPNRSLRRSVRRPSVGTSARTVGPQSRNTIGSFRGLIFDLSITFSKSPAVPADPHDISPIE